MLQHWGNRLKTGGIAGGNGFNQWLKPTTIGKSLKGNVKGLGGLTTAAFSAWDGVNGALDPPGTSPYLNEKIKSQNGHVTGIDRFTGGATNFLKGFDNTLVSAGAGAACAPSVAVSFACAAGAGYVYGQSDWNKAVDRKIEDWAPSIHSGATLAYEAPGRVRDAYNNAEGYMKPVAAVAEAIKVKNEAVKGLANGAVNIVKDIVKGSPKTTKVCLSRNKRGRCTKYQVGSGAMCFGGDGFVRMAENKLQKQIRDIKVGDFILTRDNKIDIVEYVIKTIGNNTAVKMLHENLIMTPHHPIRTSNMHNFAIPTEVLHEKIIIDVVYNFVLRNRSHLFVNNVEAPTLGDGDRDDPVLAHDYWGTKRVISDIEQISQLAEFETI